MIKKLSFALIFVIINLLNINNLYSQWDSIVFPESSAKNPKIFFSEPNIGYIFCDRGDYYKTVDGGKNWQKKLIDGIFDLQDFYFEDINNWWITDQLYLYHSSDGGNIFSKVELSSSLYFNIFISDSNIILTDPSSIIISKDRGINWEYIQPPIPNYSEFSYMKFFDKYNGIATGFNLTSLGIRGIFTYKTTNSGLNWITDTFKYAQYPSTNKNGYFFINQNVGWSICGSSTGIIYKTTDGGNNWDSIDTKTQGNKHTAISFIDSKYGFLLHWSGMLFSSDGGQSWNNENIDRFRGYNYLYYYKISKGHYKIYASARSLLYKPVIIYYRDLYLNDSTDNVDEAFSKEDFSLSPNPASEFINISYSNEIPIDNISIYNSLGFEVKRIEDYDFSGNNKINISTEEFPSGLYYCTIATRKEKFTKSFVIIK